MIQPHLIEFKSIGESSIGYISVCEQMDTIPFNIARVYWTYYTPQAVTRGGHANIEKELTLVAVAGTITVSTEMIDGTKNIFVLDKPNIGLYIPSLCWHTMQYTHNAVQVVMASNLYSDEDYIRDYNSFKEWK
jgi:dTDP-4-dehydrorhamnose 3,5-epimerase-like enzyme